jgi:hypothetical protein
MADHSPEDASVLAPLADRKRLVATLLTLLVLSFVGSWWLAIDTGSSELLLAALMIPLVLLTIPLALVARRVASHADDPEEVEARLTRSLGIDQSELDGRFDPDNDHAHPAERDMERP